MRKIYTAAAIAMALAGCSHEMPRNASFNSIRTPIMTRSHTVGVFDTRKAGDVIYSETSSGTTEGAIVDGPIDFQRIFKDMKFSPGDSLLKFSYNMVDYYCTRGDQNSDSGLSIGSICFVDEKGDGHLNKIHVLGFKTSTQVMNLGPTFDVAPAPAAYHTALVPFGAMTMQSDLVFDGVKDGYVVIEHRLHGDVQQSSIPYSRKFFAPVPQQNPVSLNIPLLPFDGMSVPASFSSPLLQSFMLTLVITKADAQSIQYSVMKTWTPWRMPQGIKERGAFTTIPATAATPTTPAGH
ncbi:hypothetical protein UCD39_22420 [Nitrospirillum sp. BR 11752]|uniref:hypothetical protein n=1 Tax=Nitrospirillum sp. BR 11752 TaxID=3104293 RepID=UPI002EC58B89|nr:hypothetical protein [Nitrospirillum sp. BR 11752]